MTKPTSKLSVVGNAPELYVTKDMPEQTKPSTSELSLPSAGIVHSDVFRTELGALLAQRASGFETGIIAITGEMESQHQAFDKAILELTAKYNESRKDLARRLSDMQKGKDMAQRQLAALDDPKE